MPIWHWSIRAVELSLSPAPGYVLTSLREGKAGFMAFSESYHCDVCGKDKSETSSDWWLMWNEDFDSPGSGGIQPSMRITRWNTLQAHAPETRHLCGATCVQTLLNRWMSGTKTATR